MWVCARERVIAGMRESGDKRKGGHRPIGSCFWNTSIKKKVMFDILRCDI